MEEESWVCVDGHGDERIFPCEPHRTYAWVEDLHDWAQRWTIDDDGSLKREYRFGVFLPKGTIKHLIGKEMTYSDKPVKLV